MKPFKKRIIAAAALGVAGCGAPTSHAQHPPPTSGASQQAIEAQVRENIARLQSLQVFTVGDLVLQSPGQSNNCYGPCPGAPSASEVVTQQAERLAKFTVVAQSVAGGSDAVACDPSQIAAHLQAVRNLQIVGVGDFLAIKPANNPSCYNLPCPSDQQKAQEETCQRATVLAQLDEGSKGL